MTTEKDEVSGDKGKERSAHNAARKISQTRARFTLQTTTNSANSEAPSIRRCRLKTWPMSGENKKEASPKDEILHERKQAR